MPFCGRVCRRAGLWYAGRRRHLVRTVGRRQQRRFGSEVTCELREEVAGGNSELRRGACTPAGRRPRQHADVRAQVHVVTAQPGEARLSLAAGEEEPLIVPGLTQDLRTEAADQRAQFRSGPSTLGNHRQHALRPAGRLPEQQRMFAGQHERRGRGPRPPMCGYLMHGRHDGSLPHIILPIIFIKIKILEEKEYQTTGWSLTRLAGLRRSSCTAPTIPCPLWPWGRAGTRDPRSSPPPAGADRPRSGPRRLGRCCSRHPAAHVGQLLPGEHAHRCQRPSSQVTAGEGRSGRGICGPRQWHSSMRRSACTGPWAGACCWDGGRNRRRRRQQWRTVAASLGFVWCGWYLLRHATVPVSNPTNDSAEGVCPA